VYCVVDFINLILDVIILRIVNSSSGGKLRLFTPRRLSFLASSFLPIRDNNRGRRRVSTFSRAGPASVMARRCETRRNVDSSDWRALSVSDASVELGVSSDIANEKEEQNSTEEESLSLDQLWYNAYCI